MKRLKEKKKPLNKNGISKTCSHYRCSFWDTLLVFCNSPIDPCVSIFHNDDDDDDVAIVIVAFAHHHHHYRRIGNRLEIHTFCQSAIAQ